MTFTTIDLANDQVLVRGNDNTGTSGECVLDGKQWAELKERTAHDKVHAAFNQKVEEFFAPVLEAAEEAAAALAKADEDEGWFVIEEPVVGEEPRPGHRVKLTHDSLVLQLIESGAGQYRLLWVNDSLVIAKESVPFSGGGSPVGQPAVQTVVD